MEKTELIKIGLEGLKVHRLRSTLTMLGIIFGVAAVIAMLSIGEGAKHEALKKYQILGVNNIIVRDKELSEKELDDVRAKFSQGLSLKDAQAISKILPTVEQVTSQAEIEVEAQYKDKSSKVTLVGVTSSFKDILNYKSRLGSFLTEEDHEKAARNCVLGSDAAKTLFPVENPLGKKVKLEDQWFEVVGVMSNKALFTETVGELAARNLNQDIYIPLSAFLMRFTKEEVLASEINQITVKVKDSNRLLESAAVIKRIIERRHHKNDDFDIIIPYELLKQEEKEAQIYNMVLGAIAAISLLVGGIGVMNIMLATVLERTREIGIRRALGAKKDEIMRQFLFESIGLSLVGGLIGITLGITMSLIIDGIADFKTIVTPFSVIIAFGVSCAVGIIFGTYPARNASNVNPIEALRYE